ncbi:SWIM zinc finger family protein [Streptomyces sp. NPDC003877]
MNARPADEARRALREARSRAAAQDQETSPGPGEEPAAQEAPRPGDVAREALRKAVSEQRGGVRAGEDRPEGEGTEEDTVGSPAPATPPGQVPPGAAERTRSGSRAGAVEPQGGDQLPDAGGQYGAAGRRQPAGPVGPARHEDPAGSTPAGTPDGVQEHQSAPAPPRGGEDTDRPGPRAADVAREALRASRDEARRAREATEREGARRRRRARQKDVDERAAAARRAADHGTGGGVPAVQRLLSDAFRMPDLPDLPDDPYDPDDQSDPSDTDEPAQPERTPSGREGASETAEALPATAEALPATAPSMSSGRSGRSAGSESHESSENNTSSSWDTARAPAPEPSAPHPPAPARSPRTPVSAGPATRSAPRTMAAPGRDNDLRRTFPAFPPREGDRFAESWWGNAWVSALEQGALDVKRLERGRGYAEQGHVDAITVTPGLVLAYVQGSRPRPYRVQVRLRTLGDSDWDRFLDAAADRPGHIAALLDKEMPQSLAQGGVPLLPGPGDLEPRCSCPDRGHPCKHAAALCYQTARLLDADPFVLLLLRGRGERQLLDALSRLSATRAARAAQDREPAPLPGVRAKEALQPRTLPPLPAPLPPPAHPEQPPAYPASPGGPDPFDLDQLATDAAARAHALLTTGRDPVGELTLWQDAVRLAAARPGSGLTAGTRALYSSLAAAAGRTPADLARAVAAWRQGGLEGLAVLEEPWDPPAGRFDRARPLLLAADLPAFRPWRNHLTHPHGHLQLRLGRDGLWYAYESEPGREDWWPRGTPDLDPVGALTGLGLSHDL